MQHCSLPPGTAPLLLPPSSGFLAVLLAGWQWNSLQAVLHHAPPPRAKQMQPLFCLEITLKDKIETAGSFFFVISLFVIRQMSDGVLFNVHQIVCPNILFFFCVYC